MKVFLMHREKDFDPKQPLPWNEGDLIQDLGMNPLLDAMGGEDPFLENVSKSALLGSLSNDPETILFRQETLKDCLRNREAVRAMYDLSLETIEKEKKTAWWGISKHPSSVLWRGSEATRIFLDALKKLRFLAEEHEPDFQSEGLRRFVEMLKLELDDSFFSAAESHLENLQFKEGLRISARLSRANKAADYTLQKPRRERKDWWGWLLGNQEPQYTIRIHERDESGLKALEEIKDRGINLVANALAQSADHILGFFVQLRVELGFFLAALNLYDRAREIGLPLAFPAVRPASEHRRSFEGLRDIGLALRLKETVVGNDLRVDSKDLVFITGANQGGKSTFLRSIGLSQLMMQSGLWVPAEQFAASTCDGLFTHYKREEDPTQVSGKLDEELSRMSSIIDRLTPSPLILFNESFASTNEREESEIASQITSALLESGARIFYVTHLHEFQNDFFEKKKENVLFLRAERLGDGTRTFKLIEGEPLKTSFAKDLYEKTFGEN